MCAGGAFGQQGTFAQIAYGGSWQTTFTLLNLSSTGLASVTLNFFGDDGSPLKAPVQGSGNTSSYTFTIPPSGSLNVVVRGQGSFRFLLPGGAISEAVVPLSASGSAACLISFPVEPGSAPVILVPFDNTTGQYVTALAIANTSNAPLAVPIEFDDQSNIQLAVDTLNLTVNQHMAFLIAQRYPALAGKKGILRIRESTAAVSVLGLLANATNAITTIIPVTQ
jgi:hypothetical protein